MGLLSSLASIAAPIAGTFLGGPVGGAIGGALGGLLGSSGQPSSSTSTQSGTQNGTQNTTQSATQNGTTSNTSSTALNPYIAQLLGANGGGLLGSLSGTLNGGSNLSGIGNSFLNANGQQILNNGYASTNNLASNQFDAPTIQGAQVAAPAQNGINLTSSFNSLLGGGDTTALNNSLNAAVNATNAGFNTNQTNVTNNLMRNILPSINGGAIAAGQYGSSRQGIAQGNAISDYTNQLTNANTQLAATNSANTTGAALSDYEQGQNRALSAAQGLSGQQYGVASQNAANAQAADNTNVNALLQTRGQNSSNTATGIGLQQGLLGSAANYGNADLSRLGQTAGILSPFLNAGATTTSNGTTAGTTTGTNNTTTTNQTTGNVSQPLYQNQGASILGGALAGSQLGSMFGGTTDYNAIRNAGSSGGLLGGLMGSTMNTAAPSSVGYYYPPTSVQTGVGSLGNLWG